MFTVSPLSIRFGGRTAAQTFNPQAPSQQPSFSQPSPDSVSLRFSGTAKDKQPPYGVEKPSSDDPYSLGEVKEVSDVLGEMLQNEYLDSGKLLDKALERIDNTPHPVTVEDYRKKYEPVLKMYRMLGENGFLGINTTEAYGGVDAETLPLDKRALATVEMSRQLAYADLGACTTMLASIGLFGEPVLDLGTEAQKQKYIPPVLTGEKIGAFGLTEPDVGSNPASLKTKATAFIGEDGQRHWKLNGTKTFISNGDTADFAVVLARTFDENGQDLGISGFIVERGDAGFTSNDVGKKVGLHTSDTAELHLDNVEVGEDRIVGGTAGLGKGKHIYNETLTGGRIGVGAQGVGVADRALDLAVQYAKERSQGGVPIASYPELREMVAKMALRNEASKVLAYHAARTKDAGLPFTKLAAMTKLMATEYAAKEATDGAIQVLGGMGFMEESKVGKLWRDARVLRIYEGTSQIQKLIIAGEILKELMADQSLLAEPKSRPRDIYQVVDQAFGQALRAAQPDLGRQFEALGFKPLKVLNASQSYAYRLALIATEREGLQAMKAQVERLKENNVPAEKEEAMLRLYAADVAKRTLDLTSEMGVSPQEDLRRFASVRKMVDHPDVSPIKDLETIAKSYLGESELPRAPEANPDQELTA